MCSVEKPQNLCSVHVPVPLGGSGYGPTRRAMPSVCVNPTLQCKIATESITNHQFSGSFNKFVGTVFSVVLSGILTPSVDAYVADLV